MSTATLQYRIGTVHTHPSGMSARSRRDTYEGIGAGNEALRAIAAQHDGLNCDVTVEPDDIIVTDGGLTVVAHWDFTTDIYHLEPVDYVGYIKARAGLS